MAHSITEKLAPTGVLRVGLNMSNFLLITGTTDRGEPDGVSPDIGRAIAKDLGVDAVMVPFKNPGDVADAAADQRWDIGNIAAEPARAKVMSFSRAYCEIQATYLLPPGSSLRSVADVDAPGVQISVKERAAYDLWLTDHLQHATLQRAPSIDASYDLFAEDNLDALAGLRPALIKQQLQMPGSTILDESFTAVQQSIGCQPGNHDVTEYLNHFVKESMANGLIQRLIDKHGVTGKLSVPEH